MIRLTGRVKFFEYARGYGFIVGNDGREVFFHRKEIAIRNHDKRVLKKKQPVSFQIGPGLKGLEAKRVMPIPG